MEEPKILPVRKQQRMVCCCVLMHTDDHGHEHPDSCPQLTSGPDEPVCPSCVAGGHVQQDNFYPRIKT